MDAVLKVLPEILVILGLEGTLTLALVGAVIFVTIKRMIAAPRISPAAAAKGAVASVTCHFEEINRQALAIVALEVKEANAKIDRIETDLAIVKDRVGRG